MGTGLGSGATSPRRVPAKFLLPQRKHCPRAIASDELSHSVFIDQECVISHRDEKLEATNSNQKASHRALHSAIVHDLFCREYAALELVRVQPESTNSRSCRVPTPANDLCGQGLILPLSLVW
jgi:hypothetical protein